MEIIFKRNYDVLNENLGSGAFGKTKLLYNEEINQKIVIKKYEPIDGIDKKKFFDYFKGEISLLHNLLHKNVVRIWDYILFPEKNIGYILMEYIEGVNIGVYAKEYRNYKSTTDINSVFMQLIDAFTYLAEKGVIHRDIRESNILISNTGIVTIIDFGIGKQLLFNNEMIEEDSLVSLMNRQQMSIFPNEFSNKVYDIKTDMFCLAELLKRIIQKYGINDFKYDTILSKMLELNPSDRYDSFAEIKDLLNKKQFESYKFEHWEKQVFRDFADNLDEILVKFNSEKVFENDIELTINKLEQIFRLNQLNNYVMNNSDLIRAFTSSGFSYKKRYIVEVDLLEKFILMLKSKDDSIKQLIMNQIYYRLALKDFVKQDLPF